MNNSNLVFAVVFFFYSSFSYSQAIFELSKGCIVDPNGECLPNTILSAIPSLRIAPDARTGGMGNVGLATPVDPNAMFYNTSKLAFANQSFGVSASYTPWLEKLSLTDVYLVNLAAFNQIDERQSIGLDLRFFSLGELSFTDFNGNPIGQGMPRETAISFGYARKLSSKFSAGLNVKYIYSNLATGLFVRGQPIVSARSFATDISFTYKSNIGNNFLTIGSSITNIGSKVSYTNSVHRDVLPTNFGIGTSYKLNLDGFNSITFSIDLNKLLVPTPIAPRISNGTPTGGTNPNFDKDGNGIADYREKGVIEGMLGSFFDAQGGLSEELKEIQYSFGLEYWYKNQFAVRTGYFHESYLKGDRKFLTVGLGVNYNVFGINLSYLVPTNNRISPLDDTLRFSLNLNFD